MQMKASVCTQRYLQALSALHDSQEYIQQSPTTCFQPFCRKLGGRVTQHQLNRPSNESGDDGSALSEHKVHLTFEYQSSS